MDADTYSIHAVVYLDQGWWVAQCLEYGLCTASWQRDELPRMLLSQLRTQIAADLARGKQPFEDLPKAPERFWKLYGEGRPIPFAVRETWLARMLQRLRKSPELRAELALIPA